MRSLLRFITISSLAALVGCEGEIARPQGPVDAPGGSTPEVSGPHDPGPVQPGACDATRAAPHPHLRRLTAVQHANSVVDLLGVALPDAQLRASVVTALAPTLRAVPDDSRPEIGGDNRFSFRRLAQVIQQSWVDATYDVALATGTLLTGPTTFNQLVPCAATATAGSATACVEGFIARFGARALRAPLTPSQLAVYVKVYGDTSRIDRAAFADVVGALLASPEFLYQVEHGAAAVEGKASTYRLTPYELAARLSYQFWDTLPDATLWAAAESGELSTEAGFEREVSRLLADPRARAPLDRFWAEWLLLEDLPLLDALNAQPDFKAFAGANLPSASLRADVIGEVLELTRHFTWTRAGTFDDLLTTDLAFARSPELAKLYGLAAPWDGVSPPPAHAAASRPGLFTRAGLLASAGVRTRPIIRGVRLRTRYLCDDLAPPPANADQVANEKTAELAATATSRERAEHITETSESCAACHKAQINPLGFTFEGFDALGRARTEEAIYSETGALLARPAVDTHAVPKVTGADMTQTASAAELMKLVQSSGKAHVCFARNYARFTLGRLDDSVEDACLVSRLGTALREGASLATVMKSIAFAPTFSERNFGPP